MLLGLLIKIIFNPSNKPSSYNKLENKLYITLMSFKKSIRNIEAVLNK